MPVRHPPGAILRLFLVAAWISFPAGSLAGPRTPPSTIAAPTATAASTTATTSPNPPASPFPLEIEKARAAIKDLRVYLDFDDDTFTFATWPVDKSLQRLPANQIARGIRLGLALWASVLPDMHFRFVNRPGEANLCFRFGEYVHSGIRPDGARAYLPRDWAPSLDFECGRLAENRYPDGSPCAEWEHNIIIIHTRTWSVRGIDFIGNEIVYRHFAWIFDPALPHYVKDGRGPCRDGRSPGTAWSDTCVPFTKSPLYDSVQGGDLAAIVQHEFGHALMGDHAMSPYECVDYARRPILSKDRCVRIFDGSFSTMYPGDGVDGYWNRRGVFEADAVRLREKGYRVSYPITGAVIRLARPGKALLETSDWREAQRAMIWPLQPAILSKAQAGRELFVVGIELP